ncbi:MAG: phospholipase D family protein [Bacteroidia bacterium]|nr:phospholipase D family protein [Bacteroidia bacterium]
MAEFLTTYGISYHIENIIMGARKQLTLVSPYLQISKTLMERLKDASNNRVSIIIIYGKDDLKASEMEALTSLNNLQLFFFENLHAKCYFNEDRMVITSMNMYEFSEKNNREMGVLIDRFKDRNLYENAYSETSSILQSAEEIKVKRPQKSSYFKSSFWRPIVPKAEKKKNGYCIRCTERIELNIEMPYCEDCFSIWERYSNPEYKENVCHKCGKNEYTTIEKPECYSCFIERR